MPVPFLPLGPREGRPSLANFAWIGVFILVSTLAFAVVVPDITGDRPFDIPRYASAVTAQNRTFVLWQDYRQLYGAVNLVEYDPAKGAGPVRTLVSGPFDCARPKAVPYGRGLMVSWLEFRHGEERFGFAEYDIESQTLGRVSRFTVEASPKGTDHSFDGRNFTAATIGRECVLLWTYDTSLLREQRSRLSTSGTPAALCQNGPSTHFGIDHDSYFTLYRSDGNAVSAAGSFKGELRELCGRGQYIAFLSKGGTNGWGQVGFTNGDKTALSDLGDFAFGLSVLERPNGMFLAWSQTMVDPDDDDQENFEVRLAFVYNPASPTIDAARTASAVDGYFSTNAAMVATADGGRLFWLDGSEGHGLWTAAFTGSAVSKPSPLLWNGRTDTTLGMILLMVVVMGSTLAMMFLLIKGSHEEKTFLVHHHNPRSYLFLRFFLPGLMFTVLIFQIGYTGASGIGSDFGSRIGRMNLVLLAIPPAAAALALGLLRQEYRVSGFHRSGYLILGSSIAVSLSGLVLYQSARAGFDTGAVGLIRVVAVSGYGLSVIGPFVMLFGLSRNRGFIAPIVAFGAMIVVSVSDVIRLSNAVIFPSVMTPMTIAGNDSEFYIIMVGMTIGLTSGFTLFSGLKLSDIRPPDEWTRADIGFERNRALILSLLIASPFTAFSVLVSIGRPLPGQMLVEGGLWMGIIFLCVLPGMFYLIRTLQDVKSFPGSFRDKPSVSIYVLYCAPALHTAFVMIATFLIGALGLLFILIYIEAIWRAEKAVRGLRLAGESVASDESE